MRTTFKPIFFAVLILTATNAFAQVGIGTNTPAASAALEVSSSTNNKGILIPRITASQKDAISNPAEGLMIYQTSAPTGFYYYSGTAWKLMVTQTDLDAKLSTVDATISLNTKVDKVSGKDLSSNDYTSAEKTKLSAITGSNTGDQDLSTLATIASVALKANAADLTSGLATKVGKETGKDLSSNDFTSAEKTKLAAISGSNTGDQDLSALATAASVALKANTADLTNGLATKVDKVTGKNLSSNDFTSDEKNKLLALTGSNTGDQDLSALATIASVALKANATDVNTDLATKVDKVTGKVLSSNDFTSDEKTKLAAISGINTGNQDLSALATIASVALKANTADLTNGLATKVDQVTGKDLSSNDFTSAEKTKLANITGIADNVSGLVAIANGGTNSTSVPIAGGIGYGTGTEHAYTNAGTSGQVLSSNGAGVPTWITSSAGVPYSGANAAVNLGDYDLKVNGLTVGKGKGAINTNSAIGVNALVNTTGGFNTAIGTSALSRNTTGDTNTAIGTSSLAYNIGGRFNTATGGGALFTNTTGNSNTATGGNALGKNEIGSNNTAHGASALYNNTTGSNNIATGGMTLFSNTAGQNNTALGTSALYANTTGSENTAIGLNALMANITGEGNTAIGNNADVASGALMNAIAIGNRAIVSASNTIQLGANGTNGTIAISNVKTSGTITADAVTYPNAHGTSGQVLTSLGSGTLTWTSGSEGLSKVTSNTITISDPFDFGGSTGFRNGALDVSTDQNLATGPDVLKLNASGIANVGIGIKNLYSNTTGSANTSVGFKGLYSNTSGQNNSSFGTYSLYHNTTGSYNSAFGSLTLLSNTTGFANTAFGEWSMVKNTTGIYNTAYGANSLYRNTTGYSNTAIGFDALSTNTTGFSNTAIGYLANVATAALTNATAIGAGAIVSADHTIQLGNTNVTNIKTSGTITAGVVTYPKTDGADGYVLTAHANGIPTWAAATGGGAGVDLTTNQIVGGLKTFSSIDGLMATGTFGSGTASSMGAGTRMMWYPKKSAFRAGTVSSTEWNDDNIGYYSTALGYSTIASGDRSIAMGESTLASGYISTATGQNSIASGNRTTAMGYTAKAIGDYSTSIGSWTTASGTYSTAMGTTARAEGLSSIAIGDNITSKSFAEIVIGTTNGDYTPASTTAFNATDRLFVIGNGNNGVSSNALIMLKNGNTTFSGTVTATVTAPSDLRLKRNIAPLQNSLDAIMQLKPVSYEKKNTLASTDYSIKENGFIAQELQKIMPNLVIEGTDKDKLLSVNYAAIIPVLTKALQEQQNAIQSQQKQIEELKLLILSMKK